jgi:hypothetical protein
VIRKKVMVYFYGLIIENTMATGCVANRRVLVFTTTQKVRRDMECGKVERDKGGSTLTNTTKNYQNYSSKRVEPSIIDKFSFDMIQTRRLFFST